MSKSKKIIVIIAVISILCSVFVLPTSAAETKVFNVSIARPNVSAGFGYMEVLYADSKAVEVLLISISTPGGGEQNLDLNDLIHVRVYQTYVTITPTAHAVAEGYSIGVFNITGHNSSGFLEADEHSGFVTSKYHSDINGIHFYGIHSVELYSGFVNNVNFVVNYGTDGLAYSQLKTITSILQNNNQSIIDNANQNAQEIQQNQNQNTQDIIDNQNQLQQNEKDEAQQSGQGSVDDVSGAIEDKSAGFISSLGNLIQTMSYTGTECAWKFPAIKLPAIEGVMPEYKLTEEQPIDFEFWVEKIPSQVLLLIRSLLTIALIVYCFKELYSTISYVLTLKGGGNGE